MQEDKGGWALDTVCGARLKIEERAVYLKADYTGSVSVNKAESETRNRVRGVGRRRSEARTDSFA